MFKRLFLSIVFVLPTFSWAGGAAFSKPAEERSPTQMQKILIAAFSFDTDEMARTKNTERLLFLAKNKNAEAQRLVVEGFSEGKYGFAVSPKELQVQHKKGNPYAMSAIIVGIKGKSYGFQKKTPEENLKLLIGYANQGNERARMFVVQALDGDFGFDKDSDRLDALISRWEK